MAPSKPAKWLVVEDSETITGSAILNSPDHKQDSTAKQSECTSSKGGGRSGLFPPRPTENGESDGGPLFPCGERADRQVSAIRRPRKQRQHADVFPKNALLGVELFGRATES